MEEPAKGGGGFLQRVGGALYMIYFLSVGVAVPYFNWTYAREHGVVSWVFFGEIVATAKAAVWPYFALQALAGRGKPNESGPSSSDIYEAHCKEPLPVFTLGERSNPTKEQEAALCACIWGSLGGWEREVSEKIATGKESAVSWLHRQAFPSRFGAALEQCGGKKL